MSGSTLSGDANALASAVIREGMGPCPKCRTRLPLLVDCADSYFENGFFLCNHCGERVDLWRASVDQAIRLRNISDSALISLGARQSWLHLRWPRAETPTHFITMGLHEDLNEATKLAVREMIDFLMNERHLSRNDAYMLSSVTADLHITELVDGNKGVHMMIPKAIFVSAQPK